MRIVSVAAAAAASFLLAGCSTTLDGFGSSSTQASADTGSITAAPTGSVTSSPNTPPVYGANAASASAAVTPMASSSTTASVPLATQAAAPGGVAYAQPGAERTQLAGQWTFAWDNGQKTCPVTLTTDHGMSGFAANADVSCPGDIFMTKGWDVWGNEIVLQNHVGKVTARLQPAGAGRYDGTIVADGGHVTMVR